MRSKELIEKDEDNLRARIQALSDNDIKLFYSKIEKEIKDPDTYAVLNWFFITGMHHFYLKEWLRGFIDIGMFGVGIILLFNGNVTSFGIAIGIFLILSIVELIQLLKSQTIVQDYNNKVTKKILDELNKK